MIITKMFPSRFPDADEFNDLQKKVNDTLVKFETIRSLTKKLLDANNALAAKVENHEKVIVELQEAIMRQFELMKDIAKTNDKLADLFGLLKDEVKANYKIAMSAFHGLGDRVETLETRADMFLRPIEKNQN